MALKLRGQRVAAAPLVDGLHDTVLRAGLIASLVTWVPGRRADIRVRGYDHAEVLGRTFAARVGLPALSLLRRSGIGGEFDQTALRRADRFRNLVGAFLAQPCELPVVIVDDLVTTGATAAACAHALRSAGAPFVEVVACCRA